MDAVHGEATHQVVAGPRGVEEDLYVRLRVDEGFRNLAPVVDGYVEADETVLQVLGIDVFAERDFRRWTSPRGDDGRVLIEITPGEDVSDNDVSRRFVESVAGLRGQAGSKVSVAIERPRTGERFDAMLERGADIVLGHRSGRGDGDARHESEQQAAAHEYP